MTDDWAIALESQYLAKKRRAISNSVSSSVIFASSANGCRADFDKNDGDPGCVADTAAAISDCSVPNRLSISPTKLSSICKYIVRSEER